LTKETDKLREKSSAISTEIKALQERILEVGGVKLRAIQSRVANTKGLLDLANEAITKAEVELAKSERDVEKLDKAIEANRSKMEEVDGELKAVEVDLEGCRGDLEIIKGKVQEAVDASQDVRESLEESKKELDEKSVDINAFRALEVRCVTGSERHKLTLLLGRWTSSRRLRITRGYRRILGINSSTGGRGTMSWNWPSSSEYFPQVRMYI
jgi:chromosome segregation ATPase